MGKYSIYNSVIEIDQIDIINKMNSSHWLKVFVCYRRRKECDDLANFE